MLLSENVYCVANIFKMTAWVEQWIFIKFSVNFEHSCAEILWWFRKLQLWATGDWQLHRDNVPTHASCLIQRFLVKHQIIQVTQHPWQPRFGALILLAFPKTKITFEREEISDYQWDSGKYDWSADGDWENCVWSQCAYFEGTEALVSYVQCFLYLTCSSINVYFSYYMAGYFLDRPYVHILGIRNWYIVLWD